MNNIFEKILDFIFPKSSLVKKIESMSTEELLKVAKIGNSDDSETLSVFNYRNEIIRQAIWEIKYRKNEKIAELLSRCLFDELIIALSDKESFENFSSPIVIPIPISKKKLKIRGFNQCELVASKLNNFSDGKTFEIVTDVLVKTKETESQTRKNRTQRLANLKGSFSLNNPNKIRNRNIILLDDVITTGATIYEAKNVLKKAGAKKIIAVTLAH